jgi:hypothetical protein
MTTNPRSNLLRLADHFVNGDRNAQYGDPNADFSRTAAYWNTHLNGVFERKLLTHLKRYPMPPGSTVAEIIEDIQVNVLEDLLDSWDVAIFIDLVKTSRLAWSPDKADSWVDKAGYAACGYDCAVSGSGEDWAGEVLDATGGK